MTRVEWRGRAIFVVYRTEEMLGTLTNDVAMLRDPDSEANDSVQPDYAKNAHRSVRPDVLGARRRLHAFGLRPAAALRGCACRSRRRLAGRLLLPVPRLEVRSRGPRVRRRSGARESPVPPYRFINDSTILIGSDAGSS